MAIETNLEYFIGTDFQFIHTITDEGGVPIDITGWALSFMIKRVAGQADAAAIVVKNVGNGIAIGGTYDPDPAENTQVATVTVLDTDTDGAAPGNCAWELKRIDPGLETILAYGAIRMIRAVHRA